MESSSLKIKFRSEKLFVPSFTFTALPSLPPVNISFDGFESLLLLNRAHWKKLKEIPGLKDVERNLDKSVKMVKEGERKLSEWSKKICKILFQTS